MKLKHLSGAALAAASLVAGQANAQSGDQQTPAPAQSESRSRPVVTVPPPIVSATVPIPSSGRLPSLHVRCDGNPDNVTAGETAARLLGAVTLLGLFAPPPEASDASARLEGPAGVAICAQALERESNDARRAQLILASAIHQIEAGNYEAAIAEARRAQSDRPDFSASRYFQLSYTLSIMEIEALALAGMGRFDDARARAMELAAAAPYDLINTLRASRYLALADGYGLAEDRFYEAGIRLYPRLIIERAMARMRARQFAAGAADIELWISVNEMTEGQDDPSFSAFAALARMAAGDAARAAEHERRARELIADLPGGTAGGLTPAMLDLLQIWRMAREGNLTQARVLFANRTGWEVASGQLVSEVARLLQAGATPAERVGHLEGDPARFGREEIARYRTRFNEVKNRFSAIRLAIAPGQFSRFAPHLARTDRSRYFTRQNDPQMPGRYLSVERDGDGIPSGYALLLHTALTAQAEGRSSFLLMPGRTEIFSAMTRIGNSGDEGMVAPLSFDAAAVVRDLGPLFPPPEPQRRR